MEPYLRNLNEKHGLMPEFVNPKYTDATNQAFKKPSRLECMMQD
jgi:UDP-sugar pyrophosphorylase